MLKTAEPTIVPMPTSLNDTNTPMMLVNSSGALPPAAMNVAPATSSVMPSFSIITSSEGTKNSSHTMASATNMYMTPMTCRMMAPLRRCSSLSSPNRRYELTRVVPEVVLQHLGRKDGVWREEEDAVCPFDNRYSLTTASGHQDDDSGEDKQMRTTTNQPYKYTGAHRHRKSCSRRPGFFPISVEDPHLKTGAQSEEHSSTLPEERVPTQRSREHRCCVRVVVEVPVREGLATGGGRRQQQGDEGEPQHEERQQPAPGRAGGNGDARSPKSPQLAPRHTSNGGLSFQDNATDEATSAGAALLLLLLLLLLLVLLQVMLLLLLLLHVSVVVVLVLVVLVVLAALELGLCEVVMPRAVRGTCRLVTASALRSTTIVAATADGAGTIEPELGDGGDGGGVLKVCDPCIGKWRPAATVRLQLLVLPLPSHSCLAPATRCILAVGAYAVVVERLLSIVVVTVVADACWLRPAAVAGWCIRNAPVGTRHDDNDGGASGDGFIASFF
uniref:Uncharacterized protein n=1 Tax=Anopheles atroparvus TaxID=41427 RepID=A0A182JFK3_ANOAO